MKKSKWAAEIQGAKKWFHKWHEEGKRVSDRFLDIRDDQETAGADWAKTLNLFHSNITTVTAMMYGSTPKIEVMRTFGDDRDDIGRAASLMASRLIQQDIQKQGEDHVSNLRSVLQDRLLPGFGTIRLRYYHEEETEIEEAIIKDGVEVAPEVQNVRITKECVEEVYTHWDDILWSPARTYKEIRWIAFRSWMTKPQVINRFGEDVAKRLAFKSKGPVPDEKEGASSDSVLPQVEIWEIWDKTSKCVYWWTDGGDGDLDKTEDPLGLDGFWPCPPPLIANITTRKYLPRSDYKIAQDLYNEIDKLQTRISLLTDACKVVGVYDKKNKEISRIFTEALENDLIPVDNWALLAEKGGIKGAIDWVPLQDVVGAIEVLTTKQAEKIDQLYQVTGMADIMRGSSQPYEAAATSKAKVQFASIKLQAMQDEFARFASDLQSLKLEIMQKHFQPESLIQQSAFDQTLSAELAPQAVELLKDYDQARWRIKIRPETLAMVDYAQMRQERTEFVMGISQFLQSAAPMIERDKRMLPGLMQILKWTMAGFKGSQDIESVMDQMIDQAAQIAQEPDKDDGQAQMQAEMQMKQMELQAKMQIEQMKAQSDMQIQQQKFQLEMQKMQQEMQQDQQKHQLEMRQMVAEFQMKMMEMKQEMTLEREKQAAQYAFNTAERNADLQNQAAGAQIDQRRGEQQLELDKQRAELKPKPNGGADA